MAEDAALGEPEIEFFFTPDYNSIPCLALARKAKEMILLGSVISGTEAAEIGLVNKAFPQKQLEAKVGLENPTIENMAAWFWRRLEGDCPGLCEIVIHETPTARCVFRGEF